MIASVIPLDSTRRPLEAVAAQASYGKPEQKEKNPLPNTDLKERSTAGSLLAAAEAAEARRFAMLGGRNKWDTRKWS